MGGNSQKWFYLVVLSIIWGSSFILIKKGLQGLTPIQVGSLRIVFAGIFLLLIGTPKLKKIPKHKWKWIFFSGLSGSFLPPFLFAIAQTQIDSGVASILNSLTPLNTLVFGLLFFGITVTPRQTWGLLIGFAGTLILVVAGNKLGGGQNYWYSLYIIIATIGYALNVNIIKRYLSGIGALAISTANFSLLVLPGLVILYFTGFFETVLQSAEMQQALLYVAVLAVVGTAIALVLFNRMVQMAGPIFASSVTYTMPLLAVFWGIVDGERLNFFQLFGGAVILLGVYLANRRKKEKRAL